MTRSVPGARFLAAAPDFALAAAALITWIAPFTLGRRFVAYLMLLMLLEFIVVHSAAFMGSVALTPRAERRGVTRSVLGLGLLYTTFVGGFALAFKTWWPLVAFWALTLNRLLPVMLGQVPDTEQRLMNQRSWAAGAMFYLLGAFLTTPFPVPRLGITRTVVAAQELPGSGLWISEPHRVVAFAFIYFLAWGVSELYAHRWIREQHLPGRARRA